MAAKEAIAKQKWGRVQRAAEAAGIGKAPAAEAKQEVIPAEPARPVRSFTPPSININLPGINIPSNLQAWITLVVALILWKISADATHAFVQDVRPGTSYWWAIGIQVMFSAIERYFFAGLKNGFTIFILVLDGFINAWGLFYSLLPRFFDSGLWSMIEVAWGGSLAMGPRGTLMAAVLLGIGLAYGNDKLFTMATSGR